MLRKRSGPTVSISCPAASRQRIVFRSVTTTPLTCGVQASVTSRMRKRLLLQRRHRHPTCPLGDVAPVDDAKLTALGLHERREALDPVAVVAVQDAVDLTDLGFVDVPAHHSRE